MAREITYRATYRDASQSPFKPRGVTLATKTVKIDADVPYEQVKIWAREAQENLVFDRLEIVE